MGQLCNKNEKRPPKGKSTDMSVSTRSQNRAQLVGQGQVFVRPGKQKEMEWMRII